MPSPSWQCRMWYCEWRVVCRATMMLMIAFQGKVWHRPSARNIFTVHSIFTVWLIVIGFVVVCRHKKRKTYIHTAIPHRCISTLSKSSGTDPNGNRANEWDTEWLGRGIVNRFCLFSKLNNWLFSRFSSEMNWIKAVFMAHNFLLNF